MALVRKAGLCALKASRVRQREIAFYMLVYVRMDDLQVGICGLTSSIDPITTCQIGKYRNPRLFRCRIRYPAISQSFRIAELPTVSPVTTLFFLGILGFSTKGYSVGS